MPLSAETPAPVSTTSEHAVRRQSTMASTMTSVPRSMVLSIVTYGFDSDAPVTEGKFVQLRLGDLEYLVFAPKQLAQFHNQILARFLADRDIEHHWVSDQSLAFEHDTLRVIGGGRFRLEPSAQSLALWDNSRAYGRFDERGLAARIKAAGHRFSAHHIEIS
jgi:hypothetical protein